MRVYLAGPISDMPNRNVPLFAAETARLRSLGYDVVNPLELNPDPHVAWLDAMRVDIPAMLTCDGIATLPGWENSKGTRIERGLACDLGLFVSMAADLTEPVRCDA